MRTLSYRTMLLAAACAAAWMRAAPAAEEKPAQKHAFEADIEKFEEADRKAPPPKGAVVFVGSSSIVKWKTLEKDMAPLKTLNRGFGGSRSGDALYYADRIVIPYAPSTIVYYEGDNDLAQEAKPEKIRDNFKAFVLKVRAAMEDVRICVISIKPSPSRAKLWPKAVETNQLLREYAQSEKNITYIDVATEMLKEGQACEELFAKDMLHMNAAGYEIWTKKVKAALEAPR